MPNKRDFEATEGLLNDVMRKQAGSVEKAVLEAVMNSVDAGASHIDVRIRPDGMTISDDGEGMTQEDIEQYFQKFGLKDDDIEDKEFGKFRMGRGQIFNFGKNVWHTRDNILVVNLDEDETFISIDGEDHELDTSGLSYNLLGTDNNVDGCTIEVDFYNLLDNQSTTVNEVKELIEFISWVHDVEIELNGEPISVEAVPDAETDDAWFFFEPEFDIGKLPSFNNKTAIYNKGAFVKTESICPVSSVIVTKTDLDVNFARNDILDTDENWKSIISDFSSATENFLVEMRDLNQRHVKWLLERAVGDDTLYLRIRDIPMIEDIEDNKWSLKELSGQDVSFSHSGDKSAKDIMEQADVLFIKQAYQGYIDDVVEESNILTYDDVLEDHNTFEMSTIEDENLSTRRRERLAMTRWYLSQVGSGAGVKAGYSQNANVWMDDDETLYVHKGLLNEDKQTFLTEGLNEILIVAAHDADTRQGRDEGHTYRRNLGRYFKHHGEAQKALLNGSADYDHY